MLISFMQSKVVIEQTVLIGGEPYAVYGQSLYLANTPGARKAKAMQVESFRQRNINSVLNQSGYDVAKGFQTYKKGGEEHG